MLSYNPYSKIVICQIVSILFSILLVCHYPSYLFSLTGETPSLILNFEIALSLLISSSLISIFFQFRDGTIAKKILSRTTMLMFITTFCFIVLEMFHSLYPVIDINKLNFILWSKLIRGNLLVSIFLFSYDALKSQIGQAQALKIIFGMTSKLITLFSFVHILLWFFVNNTLLLADPLWSTFQDNNHLSYEALVVIFLIVVTRLYDANKNTASKADYVMLAINTLAILVNTTRGATLLLILIGFYYGYCIFIKVAYRSYVKKIIYSFFIAAFITIPVYILLYSNVPRIVQELIIMNNNCSNLTVKISFAECIGNQFVQNNKDDSWNSSFYRISTVASSLANLSDNTLLGKGTFEAYKIKIQHNGIHSYNILLLSSFGIIGLLMTLFLLFPTFYYNNFHFQTKILIFFVILGTMTFTNQFEWWYGLVFFVLNIEQISHKVKQ